MPATTSLSFAEIESLLEPIDSSEPSGRDLRYEGTYDQIREVRRDEGNLPQGVWETDAKHADWARVNELCTEAIKNKSKDLTIASWLLEAWLNLFGFAGVANGFGLLTELLERYWETIYPRAEDGDLEFRASPFVWINERLNAEIKLIPFVCPDDPGAVHLSWADWEMACFQGGAVSRNTKGRKALTQDDFQRSLHLTPPSVLEGQFSAVRAAVSACSQTQEILNQKFGKESPSLQNILSVLEKIHAFLGASTPQASSATLLAMADAVTEERETLADEKRETTPQPLTATVAPRAEAGAISSRAEAYQWLAAAADYLSRTEPHSPTPYLVRRAIRWGTLSLEQLLPELVRNQGELTEINQLLQINH